MQPARATAPAAQTTSSIADQETEAVAVVVASTAGWATAGCITGAVVAEFTVDVCSDVALTGWPK